MVLSKYICTELENSCRFVGIFVWTENFIENTRTNTEKKHQIIYGYLPRYRVSQRLFDGKFEET